MKVKNWLISIFCSLSLTVAAQEFIHPGMLHSKTSLERIHGLVEKKAQPAYGSFLLLRGLPESSAQYCMKGPFETISRDGQYSFTKDPSERDFNASYYNSLLWVITGNRAHADKAMEIIRGYANTLKTIPPTNDAPLCAGLQGFMLVNAAEIMRYTYTSAVYENGWSSADTEITERMFHEVFQPVLTKFYQRKPYTNGNWGAAVTKAQLAFGIFLNDRKLYNDGIEFFYHGKDNGSLPNYISETGQIQESGRDQPHCMLGVGCLAEIAEIAWTQGQDLYSALDNRIMKGYEYLSKSNLGYDVPFVTWKDMTGKYSNWQNLGQDGMGKFRSVFEIGYNHYVERKGLEMPYTKMVLGRIRPEGSGFTCDNPGFGTLLFYLGKTITNEKEEGRIDEDLTQLQGWTLATASFKPVNGVMSLMSSGAKMQKRGIRYTAGKYPYIAVKAPRLPQKGTREWLQLCYSVNSGPEFWKLDTTKAIRRGKDMYIFHIADIQSNNGTHFTERGASITLILDFGETYGEPVVIDWIRSFERIEDIHE